MYRYQKGQELHGPHAQKKNFQNFGQFQVKQCSGMQQAQRWFGVQNYNQNMKCQWSGKRNYTGINSNQQFQNQTHSCNVMHNRYPRKNGSNRRYNPSSHQVGNFNQVGYLGQRVKSEQLAYDRNEVMKNIYRVKGVSGVRQICQQQPLQQYLSGKGTSNVQPFQNSGHSKHASSINMRSNSNSAWNKTDSSKITKHVDTQKNKWKNFSRLKDGLKYVTDTKQHSQQDTPSPACVFVTVSCAEQNDGDSSESKHCTSQIPEQVGARNIEHVNETKPPGMKTSTHTSSTATEDLQHLKKKTIPGCHDSNAEESFKQENSNWGSSTFAVKNYLTSQMHPKPVVSNMEKNDRCQQRDVKKTTAKDLVNEYVKHRVSSDSAVNSLSEQVEIRRSNGNGNHLPPDESDTQSFDKKEVEISQVGSCGNISKDGDDVGSTKETTKENDKHIPVNQLPSIRDMSKKKSYSVSPVLSRGQKTDRMDPELVSTQTEALADMERYSNMNLKPKLGKKALNERNQTHDKSSKMRSDENRIESKKEIFVRNRKPGEITNSKFKDGDKTLNDKLCKTKLEHKEKSKSGKNLLFTHSKDYGKIEKGGGTTLKYHTKYSDSHIKHSEIYKENRSVTNTKDEQKKAKISEKHIVSTDISEKAQVDKGDENVFSRMNQMIDRANNVKEVVQANTGGKSERLPFSPNQLVNRDESLKTVKFNDYVISVDGNGKISKKKIEDSKPYRLAISLVEKRRKLMKSKRKDHAKSKIKLKQKLAMESEELIKLEKNISKLKGFKIPKHRKSENNMENLEVIHEVSGKKGLEKIADLKSKKHLEQKENTNTKAVNSVGETKTENINSAKESERESRQISANAGNGHVNALKKRNMAKKRKASDINGNYFKELLKLENTIKTECMIDESLPHTKKVFNEKVPERPSDLKCQVKGNKNVLTEFQGTKMPDKSKCCGTDNNDSNKSDCQGKGYTENSTTLSENNREVKDVTIQKEQNTKFKRIRIIADSDEESPKVPEHFAKPRNKKSRLSEDDVKRALGAFSYQAGTAGNTRITEEKGLKKCFQNSLLKENRNLLKKSKPKMELDQGIKGNKALKPTFSEMSSNKLKGMHSELVKLSISSDADRKKKTKGGKKFEKSKEYKKKELNRAADNEPSIATNTETERSTDLNVERENGITNVPVNRKEKETRTENCALKDEKYAYDRNNDKKKVEKTCEKVNIKGADTDSKLPTVVKDDLANTTTHHIDNFVRNNTKNPAKDLDVSKIPDNKIAVNSKRQNEMGVSNSDKVGHQGQLITKMETCERRKSSVPDKIVRPPVNVQSKVGDLRAKRKANTILSKKGTEKDVCTRKVNLLEKKSLGYTAPGVQRMNLGSMPVSSLKNDNSMSVGKTRDDKKEQIQKGQNKHLKSVSDIVAQKLTELKAKADELMCIGTTRDSVIKDERMCKGTTQDSVIKSHHKTDINRNYCNRSRLDGDRVTSHLFRPDKTSMSERTNSISDDVYRLKSPKEENVLPGNEVIGFPITVLNTRTPTVRSIESEQEIKDTEQEKPDKFITPIQPYKDYSLPEHNKCLYNMKIRDRTALYAANLPDLETFGRDKQHMTPVESPHSSQTELKSVYGDRAASLRNDSANITALQQPRKLNLSWQDMFPVQDYYFKMKNAFEGFNVNGKDRKAIVSVTDTKGWTESENPSTSTAGDVSQAASYNHSSFISDVGQTYPPMPHSAQQMNHSDATCQLAEGPYIAYPVGNVPSVLNKHVDNVQYPGQTLSHSFPRGDNFVQTGNIHYNTPNQAGILNCNKFPKTDNYHQGSHSCQSTQNVVQYSHGMPSSHDSKLFHVSREDQTFRNGSFISPFSSKPQKEDFLNKNALSSNHEQMSCSCNPVQSFGKQQSTGWNPKIPLMDVSYDETCTNETSVYMQSVIVQHKTINRSSSDSYSRISYDTDGRESTWPAHSTQRCQNDMPANIHSDVYENSAFATNAVVSENSSLTRDTGIKIEENQVEMQENMKKPRQDINNNLNDNNETESGNAHILLEDTLKVSECKLQSSASCNETRKEGQAINEKEQLRDSDTQENVASGFSSTLLDGSEAPKSSNGSALSSCGTEKEMILDESTGQFKSVEVAVEILQSPQLQTDSVFKILDTEDHYTDQIGSSNNTSGNCLTSNAPLSNCKVDPQVKERMKYPLVMLSPLKMTKELEDMIDDYIAKNSSMFDSASLPIFHSPLFSIETPSISPRNTPKLALSSLSPPVLSPYGLPKLNENIVYEKQNMGTIKQTVSIKKQVKKKKETRSKMLKNILPSRQYDREKTLFETAEMFLGEDFANKSTRKRKRTERLGMESSKTNKKTKPDLEKQLTENKEIPYEISEHVKKLKQPADDLESYLKQKETDTKSSQETSNKTLKINHYKDNFSTEVDTRQLNAQKLRECEVNDEFEKRKISSEAKSDEEKLPVIKRLLTKTAKQLKYPATLEKKDAIIETKVCIAEDKYKGTNVNKEEGLHADASIDAKELNYGKTSLKKKDKKVTGHGKQSVKINKHRIIDTVSEKKEELECDMMKLNVLDCKNSKLQENNVKTCKESKTQNKTPDHEKSSVSGTAFTNLECTKEVTSVNVEIASDLEQTSQKPSKINPARSIVVAKKDGQWTVSTSKKKRGKSSVNKLQKTIETANFSSKARADLEKIKNAQNEDEIKCPENIVKGSQVDKLSKVNDTEITDKNDIKQCGSIRDSGILGTDKKEQQELKLKRKGGKRKQRRLKKTDNKAHQLESEEKSLSTDVTDHETRSKIQECQSSKVDKVIDTENEKLRGDMEQEDRKKTVLGKRHRTCKLNSKSNTDENDSAVKMKQTTDKSLKECKEDKKRYDMEMDHNKSDDLKIYENNVTVDKKNKMAGESSNMQNNLSSDVSPKINTHDKKSKKRKYSKNSKEVLDKSSLDTVSSISYMKKDTNKRTANKTSAKKEALKRKKMVSDHLKKYSSKSVQVKKTEVKKSGEKDDGQTKCGICDELFTKKDQVNTHIFICHPYRCNWCKVDFDSKEASKEHYFSHMKATYHCYTCNIKYGNSATFEQHMKSNRHKQKMEKCKEIQTGGQPTIIENNISDRTGRNPVVPMDENFVIETENVEKPVLQWLPENTVAQFYSSLQQASQMAWCDYSISNNNVELRYNHTDFIRYGNEHFPQFAANSNAAYQNSAVAYQGGHLNNRYLPDGTQVGPGQFGVPATDINTIGFDQRLQGQQSNGSTIDNSSVFVENGKVYTKMTDMKVQEGVHQGASDGSGYTEMTNEDVVDTDQQTETSTLCRIANSFSLSPFVAQK